MDLLLGFLAKLAQILRNGLNKGTKKVVNQNFDKLTNFPKKGQNVKKIVFLTKFLGKNSQKHKFWDK